MYIDALQRDTCRQCECDDNDIVTCALARRADTWWHLRARLTRHAAMQAADVLAFQSVELIPVEYQEYIDALQRHRAGKQLSMTSAHSRTLSLVASPLQAAFAAQTRGACCICPLHRRCLEC